MDKPARPNESAAADMQHLWDMFLYLSGRVDGVYKLIIGATIAIMVTVIGSKFFD